jgi:hypothetical protein
MHWQYWRRGISNVLQGLLLVPDILVAAAIPGIRVSLYRTLGLELLDAVAVVHLVEGSSQRAGRTQDVLVISAEGVVCQAFHALE